MNQIHKIRTLLVLKEGKANQVLISKSKVHVNTMMITKETKQKTTRNKLCKAGKKTESLC